MTIRGWLLGAYWLFWAAVGYVLPWAFFLAIWGFITLIFGLYWLFGPLLARMVRR